MTQFEFQHQLTIAKEFVGSWPEWKQEILTKSMLPTVGIPRPIVLPISDSMESLAESAEDRPLQMEDK
ncbi:hypothetical protein GC163_21170 [bacterium]|nr:hypothetical protein [bacterium]